MTQSIFRQAALERLSTPEQLDQVMRITQPTGWLALASVLLLVASAILWGFLGTVPIKVSGEGILLSPGGVLDVVANSQGRVVEVLAEPGLHIATGDIVARIDQPELRQELETAEAELRDQRDQHDQIKAFHERETAAQRAVLTQRRQNLNQSITYLRERLSFLQEREQTEVSLLKKGIINRQRFINTKIEINSVKEEIAAARNGVKETSLEEKTMAIAKERELLDNSMQIGVLERKVLALSERLNRLSAVVSPYTGKVVEQKVNVGEIVDPGLPLFSLLPMDALATLPAHAAHVAETPLLIAVLFVQPTDGKKIRPGMSVQIAPSTVKREEFGFMLGKVRHVADIPSTPEGMMRVLKNQKLVESLSGEGPPFQILVDLELDPATPSGFAWSSSRGPDTEINSGTLCVGNVTVRALRLISLAVPALEQMFNDGEVL